MSAKAEPWQTAEVAGPRKANVITKPEIAAAMIKRAKRAIIVVGTLATDAEKDTGKMIDYTIRLSKASGVPVVATAHTARDLVKAGFQPASSMSAMDIGNRLKDPSWTGLDGKGPYDLAVFLGLPYYMEYLILSGLKHFSENLKTITLDRYYNPNASWSFPNLKVEEWNQSFETIINNFGGN
ncbi:MAG: CO dehydrogenase/acetyl-CoA synthase complex subunit epsilon [Candidatus Bathyarchaeota archaeon]|nr:MAG: CO dehydrogenase/acetyl-CoA synthase complex subunit epsilon [Candidatus Bathyarchaeum tardum]WNZ29315.1 MAG: CO dehydrogenase/acetyl-CoA synthase complex subunit epsilon [Candidatus Bathyarchaeota archaeon]